MIKKLIIFTALLFLVPLESFASTTVTTNCNNVPIQENYNSPRVIAIIPNPTIVTKIGSNGEFYSIKYNDSVSGWINRGCTYEGAKEIEEEKKLGNEAIEKWNKNK